MPDSRIRNIEETEIDTILAEDIEFEGELEYHGSLLIKGSFRGEIRSQGDLYIKDSAVIEASVTADRIAVHGRIKGDVKAEKRIELFDTSRVEGSIDTPDLVMQSGCRFNGSCRMADAPGFSTQQDTNAEGAYGS
jgi:cytoskeletal protein CcmA (bactofilin family)